MAAESTGRRSLLASLAFLLAAGGCAAPRGQLDEARGQIRALRVELAQAKDRAARLQAQNRQLAARSVEDARRLASLDETNEHLTSSIAEYQAEREGYAAALQKIRGVVVSASAGDDRGTTRGRDHRP